MMHKNPGIPLDPPGQSGGLAVSSVQSPLQLSANSRTTEQSLVTPLSGQAATATSLGGSTAAQTFTFGLY